MDRTVRLYEAGATTYEIAQVMGRDHISISERLQRAGIRSVKALNADIQDWIENWNEDPKPYVWTKTAEEILDKLAGYCNAINASGH